MAEPFLALPSAYADHFLLRVLDDRSIVRKRLVL